MGSWRYTYLFPGQEESLHAAEFLVALKEDLLDLDQGIMLVRAYDGEHCEAYGDQIVVADEVEVCHRLSNRQDLLLQLNNQEIYFTCMVALSAANPHIVVAWPKRSFEDLGEQRQKIYVARLSFAASESGAEVVVFVDDPPDYFEDRFIRVGEKWMADTILPSGRENPIVEIWGRDPGLAGVLDGVKLEPAGFTSEYVRYEAQGTPD